MTVSSITNGDTWLHEPNEKDTAAIAALKTDWRRIAELELAECRVRDHAEQTTANWAGRANAARNRIDRLQVDRAKVEAALEALR